MEVAKLYDPEAVQACRQAGNAHIVGLQYRGKRLVETGINQKCQQQQDDHTLDQPPPAAGGRRALGRRRHLAPYLTRLWDRHRGGIRAQSAVRPHRQPRASQNAAPALARGRQAG